MDAVSLPRSKYTLLTQTFLLNYLDCEESTFREMRAAGLFPDPSLYVGKKPRWTVADVRRWVMKERENQVGPKERETAQKGSKSPKSEDGLAGGS